MNLVFFGSGEFGLASLDAIAASPHKLLALVTAPDKPKGRALKPQPTLIKRWANDHSIPVIECAHIKSEELEKKLKSLSADVFAVISFGALLPKALLDIPKKAALNVHSSLLPKYRGAAPIQWAILNGDKETGVTIMRLSSKLDTGDIALQKKTVIQPNDNYESLERRLGQIGADALIEVLNQIDTGKVHYEPQKEREFTYARKLNKDDGKINWALPAERIERQVRAMHKWPTSYSFYKGKRLIITRVSVEKDSSGKKPGTVLSVQKNIMIQAGDGALLLLSVKPEGKSEMSGNDFARGHSIQAGEFFE